MSFHSFAAKSQASKGVSPIKSPARNLGLDFLLALQDSFYISVGGQEYYSDEVDALVAEKSDLLLDDAGEAAWDSWEAVAEMEAELAPVAKVVSFIVNAPAYVAGLIKGFFMNAVAEQSAIARIIRDQIGGRRLHALGATKLAAMPRTDSRLGGLVFKASLFGARQLRVQVELTAADFYRVTLLRARTPGVIAKLQDLDCEMLGPEVELAVENFFQSGVSA